MILIDTHILIWWMNQDNALSRAQKDLLALSDSIAVSIISLWEISKLVELGRLEINRPVKQWLQDAVSHPKIVIIPLELDIVVLSTQLPGTFHKDPADQLIVASAMHLKCPLLTSDHKILQYPFIETVG